MLEEARPLAQSLAKQATDNVTDVLGHIDALAAYAGQSPLPVAKRPVSSRGRAVEPDSRNTGAPMRTRVQPGS